jgi:hypothetical protein
MVWKSHKLLNTSLFLRDLYSKPSRYIRNLDSNIWVNNQYTNSNLQLIRKMVNKKITNLLNLLLLIAYISLLIFIIINILS